MIFTLATAQRAQLIAELRDRIAHGRVKDAKSALCQLTLIPSPPIDVFVTAAAAPSRRVAVQAQTSISELLRNWKNDLAADRHTRRVARQLDELASQLNAHRDSFSSLDHAWLAGTAEQIVRLANVAPDAMSPELAMRCESLLAVSTPTRMAAASFQSTGSTMFAEAPDNIFMSPSRRSLESIVPAKKPSAIEEVEALPSDVPSASNNLPANNLLYWSHPHFEPLPAAPAPRTFVAQSPSDSSVKLTPISNMHQDVPAALASQLRGVDTRTLLENWLDANRFERIEYTEELHRRGFSSLRTDVIRLALSDHTPGRIRLIQDLIDAPGAQAWLLFLAQDENAEVRLSAITLMATSSDPALRDQAWRLALHDEEPRIARVASQLQERHGSSQRH